MKSHRITTVSTKNHPLSPDEDTETDSSLANTEMLSFSSLSMDRQEADADGHDDRREGETSVHQRPSEVSSEKALRFEKMAETLSMAQLEAQVTFLRCHLRLSREAVEGGGSQDSSPLSALQDSKLAMQRAQIISLREVLHTEIGRENKTREIDNGLQMERKHLRERSRQLTTETCELNHILARERDEVAALKNCFAEVLMKDAQNDASRGGREGFLYKVSGALKKYPKDTGTSAMSDVRQTQRQRTKGRLSPEALGDKPARGRFSVPRSVAVPKVKVISKRMQQLRQMSSIIFSGFGIHTSRHLMILAEESRTTRTPTS